MYASQFFQIFEFSRQNCYFCAWLVIYVTEFVQMLQNETFRLIFKHCAYLGMFVCCLPPFPLFSLALISFLTQNVQFSITLMINVQHLYFPAGEIAESLVWLVTKF